MFLKINSFMLSAEIQSKLHLTGGLRALSDLLELYTTTADNHLSGSKLLLVTHLVGTLGFAIVGHGKVTCIRN